MASLEGGFLSRTKHAAGMSEVRHVVSEYLYRDVLPETCSVLHNRSRGRGGLLRLISSDLGEIVAKVWVNPNVKDRVKCRLGISNAQHEWRMQQRLFAAGMHVPSPLGYLSFRCGRQTVEVLTISYIGEVTSGLVHLKACMASGSENRIAHFEREVIDMTRTMIGAKVLDMDHQLNNIVVTSRNEVFRLDVECARRWRFIPLPDKAYGETVGRLVSSHAYASQPELYRTEDFASRLADALSPPEAALSHAAAVIERALARQKVRSGTDSRLNLAW